MKIFVISLEGSCARREKSKAQLDCAGVDFEFFDAIRGETALQDYFDGYDENQFLLNTGRTASLGEIGCYASHLALWKQCIESNQAMMIMEDDFLLDAVFADAAKLVAENIGEYGHIRLQSETRAKKRLVKQMGNFQLWRYTKVPHSTMCYGISPPVAKSFVSSSSTFSAPVDVHVKKFWEHGHLMYGLTPYTVTESQASSDSTIEPKKTPSKPLKIRLHRVITKCGWFVNRLRFNLSACGWR